MQLTPEQVQKFKFRSRLEAEQAAAPPQDAPKEYAEGAEPWYQDFGEGLGVSGLKTYTGVKDLLGTISPFGSGASPKDRDRLDDWKADAGQSGWGTGGEIVGDIGQIIGTGGIGGGAVKGGLSLAAKGAAKAAAKKGASRTLAKSLLKARNISSPIARDVAAAAAVGGAQAPERGETRMGNAVGDGGAALAGGVLFKALGKAVRGINKTPAGQRALDAGDRLTPAMVSQGSSIQGVENLMQVLPSLAIGRQTARDAAEASWVGRVMREAAPVGAKITGTAKDRAIMLKDSFTKGYSTAWSKAEKPTTGQILNIQEMLRKTGGFVDDAGKGTLKKISNDLKNISGSKFNSEVLQNLDRSMKAQIATAARNGNSALEDGLNAARVALRDTLPDAANAELKALDNQYGKYLVVKKAGAAAADNKGNFTPAQLMNSVKTVGGETRTFTSQAPMQKLADDAMETVGRTEPAILQDIQKGLIAKVPTNQPTMDLGGRLTMGETSAQKLADRIINNPVAEALRKSGFRGSMLNVADNKIQEQ
jgi:hypothetical protein